MFRKTGTLAALAATVALAVPAAGLADDGTPASQKPGAAKAVRVLTKIAKLEARLAIAKQRLAIREQKVAERCNAPQPAPPTTDGQPSASAASPADHCARVMIRLHKMEDKLQKVQDRLEKMKARLQQWLQNHGGSGKDARAGSSDDTGSTLSAADQQALDDLQQQLENVQ